MKKRLLILFIFLIFGTLTIGLGAYIIKNLDLTILDVQKKEDNGEYHKVVFNDTSGNPTKTLYVAHGDSIKTSDAPFVSDGNNYYTWKDSSGNVLLDVSSNGLSKEIIVNNDVVFSPTAISLPSKTTSVNDLGSYTNNKNRSRVRTNDGKILLEEKNYDIEHGNTSSTSAAELVLDKGIYNNLEIESRYRYSDTYEGIFNVYYQEVSNDASTNARQVNGDTSIGLEDPTSLLSDYKPYIQEKNGKNYCVSRIKLGADTILTGQSNITLGAYAGFFGSNQTYSQINFQGFIMGPYNELDLNGHTLIVDSGSSIIAYGSITDTSADRTGKIIMKSGSTLKATFVVEDQHHETSAPMSYLYGGPLFSMYRCPYLDCNIRFENGAAFYGMFMLDWGGAAISGYTVDEIRLLGSSNNSYYMIDFQNYDDGLGYIERIVTYDDNLTQKLNTFEKENLMSQRITYNAYFADINLNLPDYLSAELGPKALSISFTVDFNKSSWNVSPYYSFNLYNSKLTIKNMISFLPGSSLYLDEKSLIVMTHGAEDYSESMNKTMGIGYDISSQFFVNYASLNFCIEKYEFNEQGDISKYFDTSDAVGQMVGGNALIYSSAPNFWKYMNAKHAVFTLDGKIQFSNIDTSLVPNLGNGNFPYYQLGGNINIKNEDAFKDKVESSGRVQLYSTFYKSGPDRLTDGNKDLYHRLNISDYFTLPLISNGNVLMDINDTSTVRSDFRTVKATYDFTEGLINYSNEYYGFFPLKGNEYNLTSIGHFFRSGYGTSSEWYNGQDDLTGRFIKVTRRSLPGSTYCEYVTVNDSSVSFNNQNFAFFRGQFSQFSVTSSGYTINLRRFKMIQDVTADNYISAKFVSSDDSYYTHPAWRLS